MPYMVNGCGTTYYGKKNVESYQGVCGLCNANTTLTSYDTMHWFVLVMIPIIPLGRKRIIEECASCQRHRAMKLVEWNALHDRMNQAVTDYQSNPGNKEKAKAALQACVGFRDLETLLKLAPLVEQHQGQDAKLLELVGACYEMFGRYADMERVLRKAVDMDNSDDHREGVGLALLNQEKPKEAEPFLEHIYVKGIPDRVNLLYHLAQIYQVKGMHDQAAMIFEHALSVDPSMADDPTFARLREESLKRLGSNEKIAPKKIVDKAKNIESAKKIGKFFGVAAVLAVFAYLTLSMIQGQRQTIYVVNGLPQAYTVSINGKALQLKPLAVTKARVPQGTVTIASTDPLLPTQSQTAVISTSFLTRPFDDHAFVFNPDHAAIISRIRAVYTVRSAKDPGVPQMRTYFAGQFFHPFDNIDFPFEPFPESMEMSEHQDELVKFGLVQVNETSRMKFPTILQLIGAKLDDVQRLEVARQRFLAEPTESGYLDLIEDLSSHEDYLALLKPLLDRRPLLMNCHRYYQNALRMTDESASMVASYESMLAADSGNKDLMYLVARVIGHKDVARGISLCKAASQSPDPSAYALFWMAGYCLEMGEFDHALQYGKQALAMPTHIAGLEDIYAEALLGAGRHDEALTLFKAIQQRPVSQGGVAGFYQETYLHLAMGNQAEAQNILSALRAKLKGFDPRDVKSIMESLEAGMAYCMGDLEKYIAYSNETKSTSQNCAGHLTAGDLASAHADVQAKDAHYVEHLLVYIVATLKGQSEIAEKELASAIQMMVTTCDGEQMYANALAGKEVGPIEQLLQQRAGRGAKVVILTALGLHDPKAREACFAMVKKLDISKRYPHRIIEDAMTYSQAN